MSNKAPVCHISTDQQIIQQPRPTLLPSIPTPTDVPSLINTVNVLKLLIQQLAGQQGVGGPAGRNGVAGPRGAAGVPGLSIGVQGAAGPAGARGPKGSTGPKGGGDFQEDRGQRVVKKVKVYQDNDNTSDNWVEISRVDRVVWVDSVTGRQIIWERGGDQ